MQCELQEGGEKDDGWGWKEENRRRRQHLGAYPAGPKMEKGKRKKRGRGCGERGVGRERDTQMYELMV